MGTDCYICGEPASEHDIDRTCPTPENDAKLLARYDFLGALNAAFVAFAAGEITETQLNQITDSATVEDRDTYHELVECGKAAARHYHRTGQCLARNDQLRPSREYTCRHCND